MSLTITLPDRLATTLRTKAEAFHQPVNEFTINFLDRAFSGTPYHYPAPQKSTPMPILGQEELRYCDYEDDYPTLEEVVAKIKATPPNPAMIQYPNESLLEYLLQSTPEPDPNFDVEEWNREWAKVEVELEALDPPHDPTEEDF